MPTHHSHSADTPILRHTTQWRAEEWVRLTREDPPLMPSMLTPAPGGPTVNMTRWDDQLQFLGRKNAMRGRGQQALPTPMPSVSSTCAQYAPSCNLDGSRYPQMRNTPRNPVRAGAGLRLRGRPTPIPQMPAPLALTASTILPTNPRAPTRNPRVPVPYHPTIPAPGMSVANAVRHAPLHKPQGKVAPHHSTHKRRVRYASLPSGGTDVPGSDTELELDAPRTRVASGSSMAWRRLGGNVLLGIFLWVLPDAPRDGEVGKGRRETRSGKGRQGDGDHKGRRESGERRDGKRERDTRRPRERERRTERRQSRSRDRRQRR